MKNAELLPLKMQPFTLYKNYYITGGRGGRGFGNRSFQDQGPPEQVVGEFRKKYCHCIYFHGTKVCSFAVFSIVTGT